MLYAHKVDSFVFLYRPAGNFFKRSVEYILKDIPEAVIVIEGVSKNLKVSKQERDNENAGSLQYIQRFEQLDIMTVVLASIAAHPQFVGDKRAEDLPYEFLGLSKLKAEKARLKDLALEQGYCLENQATFRAMHVYCDTLPCCLAMTTFKQRERFEQLMHQSLALLPLEMRVVVSEYLFASCLEVINESGRAQ